VECVKDRQPPAGRAGGNGCGRRSATGRTQAQGTGHRRAGQQPPSGDVARGRLPWCSRSTQAAGRRTAADFGDRP